MNFDFKERNRRNILPVELGRLCCMLLIMRISQTFRLSVRSRKITCRFASIALTDWLLFSPLKARFDGIFS